MEEDAVNLQLDVSVADAYASATQKARVMTETWMADNMFCPHCGRERLQHFPNNREVADFHCPDCRAEYELKGRKGVFGRKMGDGAYDAMMRRIMSPTAPDFFLMRYSLAQACVTDLIFIPKHFVVPAVIEKRKPLSATARRAGWTGCNILLDGIPEQGRIAVVSGGVAHEKKEILNRVGRAVALNIPDLNARGWLLDTLACVNRMPGNVFSLADMYAFEAELARKHPNNRNVRPKIRQMLQVLRDRGFLTFTGRGTYRKTG